MKTPTTELLRADVAALDVPSVPAFTLASTPASQANSDREPVTYAPPVQGLTKPVLNPDDTLEVPDAY